MAPRKSRARKTADKMAAYKDRMDKEKGQGTRTSPPRKSPRRGPSKSPSVGSCSSIPRGNSDGTKQSRQKNPSVRSPSSNTTRNKGVVDDGAPTTLEALVEIPETPPRESQVIGRKRSIAPHPLRLRTGDTAMDSEEHQKPSKKRKSFNTPPRGDVDGGGVDRNSISDPISLSDAAAPTNGERLDVLPMNLFGEDSSVGTQEEADQLQSEWVFHSPHDERHAGGTNPKARLTGDLEYMCTSTAELGRQFGALKKVLLEEMRGLYRTQKSDMRELQESIVKPLLSDVRDLRGVLERMSNGSKTSNSGKNGSKTSLHEWEEKLNKLTPKAEVVFNKEVFARILCCNAPWKVYEVYDGEIGSLGSRVSTAAQVLLFSHQPSSKKNDFSDGFGKLHSEFKYSVVQNTFYNVCKRDVFGLFRPNGDGGTADISGLPSHSGENFRLVRPAWLEANYVTVEHINDARKFIECTNQSRKGKVRGTPNSDDVASHGALRLYRQLGAHLHRGRDYMKMSFFQSLGYVFVPWKRCVKDNDQRNMVLRLTEDDTNMLSTFSLEDVPCTDLCTVGADVHKTSEVNTGNRNLLKRMFSDWPCMVLTVEHDVHVSRGGGGQRRRPGGERRKLRRLINLIEVACNVLVEYTRVGSTDIFLRGHKYALRTVMIFALLFRELTAEFIAMREAIEPDPDDPEKTVPDPEVVVVHDTSLKGFLPGRSVHESQLGPKFLRITEKMYDTWNVVDDGDDVSGVPGSGDAVLVTEIAESNEYGVAAI